MSEKSDTSLRFAILFSILFPSLVTWLYFVSLADQAAAIQQTAYGIGKTIQFAFPAVWVLLVQREKWRRPDSWLRGVPLGLLFGIAVAAVMFLLYWLWLSQSPIFERPAEVIRDKVTATGFGSSASYLGLGVFYVVFHSLMEEYYWRWFVFRKLREEASFWPAAVISSLGFMAHHVILLAVYFEWDSPVTWLFSLAIATGGAAWAWLYERSGTLLAPWFSHAVVDAAIFLIGYQVLRS